MGYLDPGIFGILSQVGLTAFLLIVAGFTFFFRPIKKFFKRLFGGKEQKQSESSSTEEQINQ